MPVSKKKPTTSAPESSTPEQSSPVLPGQEEFRQHLRRIAVSAVQVLIEQVMVEELEQCIGASWGECTPNRRGYRNGFSTRDWSSLNRTHRGSEGSKTIEKESFTHRPSSATTAMSQR